MFPLHTREILFGGLAILALLGCGQAAIAETDAALTGPIARSFFALPLELDLDSGECAYIGDAQRDIEAGRAAGMFTIAVSWGYIPADEDIHQWDAHRVLDAPHEILEYVPQQGLGT